MQAVSTGKGKEATRTARLGRSACDYSRASILGGVVGKQREHDWSRGRKQPEVGENVQVVFL